MSPFRSSVLCVAAVLDREDSVLNSGRIARLVIEALEADGWMPRFGRVTPVVVVCSSCNGEGEVWRNGLHGPVATGCDECNRDGWILAETKQ